MVLIWKREIRSYLYTPLMYVFLFVFFSLSSVFFMIGNLAARSGNMLTCLSNMSYLWMLLTPVLTMKLLSAGTSGGDQQLYGSSLPLSRIVFGKYLAAFSILLCAVIVSLIYPLVIFLSGTLYWHETLAGYIGFLLLGACYLALDLLIASLTKTPLVALIACSGSNLFCWLIDVLLKAINAPVLSDIGERISLYRHLSAFLSGRIALGDIIFDLSFVFMALFMCIRVLEVRRWRSGL